MSKEVLLLPGPDPGPAVTCSVFQALIQSPHRAESCTCHSLHKPTFGPNATEQYAKLLLGMCAAAVRVSRETFVSVTPNGHFAGLIFLSRDSHSLATCFSALGAGWIACTLELKTPCYTHAGELRMCREKENIPPCHAKRWSLFSTHHFGDVDFFSCTGGNQFSRCMCGILCAQR